MYCDDGRQYSVGEHKAAYAQEANAQGLPAWQSAVTDDNAADAAVCAAEARDDVGADDDTAK